MTAQPEWETYKGFASSVDVSLKASGKLSMPVFVTRFRINGQPIEFEEVCSPFKRPRFLEDGEFVAVAGFTYKGLYRAEYLGLPIGGKLLCAKHGAEAPFAFLAIALMIAGFVLGSSEWSLLSILLIALSFWFAAGAGSMRRGSRLIAGLVRPSRLLA